MKNTIYLVLIAFIISSCSYTIYDRNNGELKIAKKVSYTVDYMMMIPNGTPAEIEYTDKDGQQHTDKCVAGGRWEKVIVIPSGTAVKFNTNITLPKTDPPSRLVTIVKVDNEVVTEQVQTGKKVIYRLAFKLP